MNLYKNFYSEHPDSQPVLAFGLAPPWTCALSRRWQTGIPLGAVFTIAICAMWPTVLNTAVGVRAIPQDYVNVARVLRLGKFKTLMKVLLPASLPYMFTGFRLSLGIAWLVIVAAEMLTGRPGVGGVLLQVYNAGISGSNILSILTIGVGGVVLHRLMNVGERNGDPILNLPGCALRTT